MKEVTIKNENIEVTIKIQDTIEGITWVKVLREVYNNLKAHTYVMSSLEEFIEEKEN